MTEDTSRIISGTALCESTASAHGPTVQGKRMNCHVCEYPYEYDSVSLFVCPRCGHGFRTFDGDPLHYHMSEYRSLFRRNQNEFDADGKPNKLFHKSRRGIVRKRKALVKKYLDKNDHCLDIGSGGGTFCKEIMKFVKSLECIELNHQLVEECRRLGFVTYSNDFIRHEFNKTYDTVLLGMFSNTSKM